ncbi:hypothetical protein EDB89DRAFT_2066510 [Lactarius sanguifluus]|nr:hypothetical protein EDB89DRAFT_2066510 [Lactarius sanguifluus]
MWSDSALWITAPSLSSSSSVWLSSSPLVSEGAGVLGSDILGSSSGCPSMHPYCSLVGPSGWAYYIPPVVYRIPHNLYPALMLKVELNWAVPAPRNCAEFVQGSSTSGTQYEYTLTDIHGEPPSGLPSPISRPTTPRPATPLEYGEEAFPPEFDIRTQVAVRSAPLQEPTPELVYPDPPSEPTPSPRPISAPPCIPSPPPHNQSRASTPPRVPTPDSPIDYERVAEQSPVDSTATDLPSEWENILPASFFQPPSCVNSPEEHPHLYTAVYSAEGESWRPASITVREHFSRIPLAPALAQASPVFPSVTPFRIPPPHLARAQFDTHRDRQLRRYYPSTSYYDISESSRIDSWVDPPLVLKSLVNLFEFGETWDTYAFNDFQDDLSAVVDACNDQLLFWHLSDRTPEQLVLWTKSDYLWFNHIPP